MAVAKTKEYIEGIGRRKEAVARVRIYPGAKGDIVVNDKKVEDFFSLPRLVNTVQAPFNIEDTAIAQPSITVHVHGGGITAQAEAIRLGIARALVKHDAELRPALKHAGFLKRDPRVVERKKFGLKKARRAPQWSKR